MWLFWGLLLSALVCFAGAETVVEVGAAGEVAESSTDPPPSAPLVVLFDGWLDVPHSYAVVSCFELAHLFSLYGPRGIISPNALQLYRREAPYLRPEWSLKSGAIRSLYPANMAALISSIPVWNESTSARVKLDLIYRRSYPFDLSNPASSSGRAQPMLVFYTSEFGHDSMQRADFLLSRLSPTVIEESDVQRHISRHQSRLWFSTPSNHSSQGLGRFLPPGAGAGAGARNKIIPHGVDTSVFYRLPAHERRQAREQRGLGSDFVILSVGAMTANKGVAELLAALHILIHQHGVHNARLYLKGLGDIYASRQFLSEAFDKFRGLHLAALQAKSSTSEEELAEQFRQTVSRVKYFENTLTFAELNELYNAADVYVSPTQGEAYGLTPLEALAAGTRVVVPKSWGGGDFASDIHEHLEGGAEYFVNFVSSTEGRVQQDKLIINVVSPLDLSKTILGIVQSTRDEEDDEDEGKDEGEDEDEDDGERKRKSEREQKYQALRVFINERHSWRRAAELLFSTFEQIRSSS